MFFFEKVCEYQAKNLLSQRVDYQILICPQILTPNKV